MERKALVLGVLFTAEVLVMLCRQVAVGVPVSGADAAVCLSAAPAGGMLLREAHLHLKADVAAGPGPG
jgi:hypothetical protein